MVKITEEELEKARQAFRKKHPKRKRRRGIASVPSDVRLALLDPQESTRRRTKVLLERGEIKRYPCAICGDPNAEAHHPDYDDPSYIVWLCKYHHSEHHLYDCIQNGKDGRVFANYLRKYYKKPPFDYYD